MFSLYKAGISAAHPKTLLAKRSSKFGSLRNPIILGAGKASLPMAEAFLNGRKGEGCIVVTKRRSTKTGLQVLEGSHPIPSNRSVQAAKRLIDVIRQESESRPILFFLSGGASALLELPSPGIALHDFVEMTQLLLHCGASIAEINAIRKHLSDVKGGRLALTMGKRKCITWVLSDVEGDRLDVIGGAPTYPDPSTYKDATRVLKKYKLWNKLSDNMRRFWNRGLHGELPETPKPGNPIFENHSWHIIGNAKMARAGVIEKANALGLHEVEHSRFLNGEAQEVGKWLARQSQKLPSGTLWVGSGEPVVSGIKGGKGGRCQEVALAFLIESAGQKEAHLLAAGTDGIDGPTDAAGAYASTQSHEKARIQGLRPKDFLRRHDSYHFFKKMGDLIKIGLTGTNVNDLFILWVS